MLRQRRRNLCDSQQIDVGEALNNRPIDEAVDRASGADTSVPRRLRTRRRELCQRGAGHDSTYCRCGKRQRWNAARAA